MFPPALFLPLRRLQLLVPWQGHFQLAAPATHQPQCPRRLYAQVHEKRVYISEHKGDNPNTNYIGLIIGPRGNTHRRLCQETMCRCPCAL